MIVRALERDSVRPSAFVASLFPSGVFAAELREAGDPTTLLPAEAACCKGFSPRRAAEFAAGRGCAHAALAELGHPRTPLCVGADRLPTWPAPVRGSISHTLGFCAAVVGRRRDFAALGLDVERVGRVSPDLWSHVFVSDEIAWLDALSKAERPRAATILFAAKEAFYKCQFVVSSQWLDFTDVAVTLRWDDEVCGELVVRPLLPLHPQVTGSPRRGRFRVHDDLALAGIALRAPLGQRA
jgi:4'-phosphopantetheinyl transferase EntD